MKITRLMFTVGALLLSFSLCAFAGGTSPAQRTGTLKLSPEAKTAIDRGLTWVAQNQNADGSWSGSGHPTADTSLCLMAFLLQGHVPGRGLYGQNMDRAIIWLIKKSEKQGGYLGTGTTGGGMYEHGLAVLALSEAWGQSKNPEIRNTLKKAVAITLRSQHPTIGGWRYSPQPDPAGGDMSMTGMHIIALNSAKEAGIYIPDATFQLAVKFVLSCQDQVSGGFTYTPGGGGAGVARTGAAVLSLLLSGERENSAVKLGMRYLLNHPDGKFACENLLYTHYYAIQCMYQSGDDDFNYWYPRIADVLLSKQRTDGSWDVEHGSAYSTPMAILILGVPYRFLPIYQR